MISLIFLILCSLGTCLAAHFGIFSETLRRMPDGSAKWEALAECSLTFNLLPFGLIDSDRSMFDVTIATFLKASELNESNLYENLMIGLCDHLNKKSLQIILKSNSGQSIADESLEFVKKLKIAAKESNHFSEMKLPDFKYPVKTLKLIYEALRAIDLNVETTFDLVVDFVKHHDTFEYLDIPLNMILKGIRTHRKALPFIKFNKALIGNSAFDNFIGACHEHFLGAYSDGLNHVRNIIYGPITDVSTALFYETINQDLLKVLITSEDEYNRLMYRVITSETYHRFSVFFTPELVQRNPSVARFQKDLERQIKNYDAIEFIIDYGIDELLGMTSDEKDVHFQFLIDHKNCMEEYYEIDPEFIGECVEFVHEKIMEILEETRYLTTEGGMSGCAALIVYYLGLIPLKDFTKHLKDINYMPVMDLLLNPLVVKDQRLFKIIHVRKVIYLSYVKVDYDTLSKFLDVLQAFYSEYEELFSYTAFAIIQERPKFSEKEAFELFKVLHRVFESRQMNFEAVATVYLYKSAVRNFGSASKIFNDYVKEHKLVSKTILNLSK